MQNGVGLVLLHQASTVPADDVTLRLERWVGGARYGMIDRADETVAFTPAEHPVSQGVSPFAYKDEFYPTVHLVPGISPILAGRLHAVNATTGAITIETVPVAWVFTRPGGGRSFTFTGLHYLAALDNAQLRTLLLNAIAWTARMRIPALGIRTAPVGPVLRKSGQAQVIRHPWGELRWFTSAELGNSASVTTGEATLNPGERTPLHFHPNCDETLRVVSGQIVESVEERSFRMGPGDVVTIPRGLPHASMNDRAGNAVLDLTCSSANRETVGE
jgi:mannose-6-phosphate isomerase-like protein (cupin superfamily)